MKHEWKKSEKEIYLPKENPTLIKIPVYKYYTLEGKGNPNDETFANAVQALYAMAYGVKMMPKKGINPDGYFEYTIYPLEGIWKLNSSKKKKMNCERTLDLADLEYKIMIRQPDFVTEELAIENINEISIKKVNINNDSIKFETIEDGLSVQLLHKGSYTNEYESFELIDSFCVQHRLERVNYSHREIYLSDPRRVKPDNYKTTLRVSVQSIEL